MKKRDRNHSGFIALFLNKKHALFIAVLVVFRLVPGAVAGEIQLRTGVRLTKGTGDLDVGSYAIPCAADWNGDARKDLLVGYQTDGKISLFLNAGPDDAPVFTNGSPIKANGADIVHVSAGNCGAPVPFVCDYNNDGKRDLLVGEGAVGNVYFYKNTNTDARPVLTAGVTLKVNGSTVLAVPTRAAPYVYDWDGDGKKDLLCGCGDGYVYFFKNTNNAATPVYIAATKIRAQGADLNLGALSRSVVRMSDWNGDGVDDLVCSSKFGVYWCRNTGQSHSPILQATNALCEPYPATRKLKPIYTGDRMRLDVVDWNNDGVTDILVGSTDGTVSLFQGYQFGFTSLIKRQSGTNLLSWQSASNLTYRVLCGNSANTVTNVAVTNVLSGGKTTVCTNCATCPVRFYKVQIE